ncbi:precorrin-2 C(20)-methyltransferase [Caldiplasma sukawensis]
MKELTVVGLGPGNPELISIMGLNVLRESNVIYFPWSGQNSSISFKIVETLMNRYKFNENVELKKLVFPMTRDNKYNNSFWEKNADIIEEDEKRFKKMSYAVLGSPVFFSTFNRLMNILKERGFLINIIPGINSMDSCSSSMGLNLAEGDQTIIVTTYNCTGNLDVSAAETLVILKVPDAKFVEILKDRFPGFKIVKYGRRCSTEREMIGDSSDELPFDYFSLVIMKR